jgi:hypothetical protein
MEIGDCIIYEKNLKFYCFEMLEEEYKGIKEWREECY